MPTERRSVELSLEATGSGWLALLVAVLTSVVPAALAATWTVTSTEKLALTASDPTMQVTTPAAFVHAP